MQAMLIRPAASADPQLVPALQAWSTAVQALLEECRSGDVVKELGLPVALALADVGICNILYAYDLEALRSIPGVRRAKRELQIAQLGHRLYRTELALYRLYGLLLDRPGPWSALFQDRIRTLTA
ncbi:hypothetical protein [Deinococcus planocerae]|uniref:hypothetical protein n=1 Tax=Deinococcus planocerae TaxID=1737569 RepID=UPI0011AEF953|nr:hypothetical protein [Deinococcus planocerae]